MRATGSGHLGKWAGLLLVLGVALGVQAAPPGKLPGRKAGSGEPWGAFLGRAAHTAIGKQYVAQHPTHLVFLNNVNLHDIVEGGELGDPTRLSKLVQRLRPDITDTSARVLFEIKPDHEEGRSQAREQAGRYLAALNAVIESDKKLVGGTDFNGSLFLEFETGGSLWQLSWRTPEPGVTLYRWSYRRKKAHASWKESAAQNEEALPDEEIEQHGALVEQAIRNAYDGGERPSGFRGQVYRPVDCH